MKKTLLKWTAFLLFIIFCITSNPASNAASAENFNKTKAKKNITVTYKKVPDGILAIYKNKNDYTVKLTGKVRFLDASKNELSAIKEINNCVGAKSTCAIFYPAPYDSDGNVIKYNSYKGTFSVAKTKYKSYSKKMTVGTDLQTIGTNVSVVNTSGKKLNNIHVTAVFYGSDNSILGCQGKYVNCYEKGSIDLFTLDHKSSWGRPSKVKIYVNWAY